MLEVGRIAVNGKIDQGWNRASLTPLSHHVTTLSHHALPVENILEDSNGGEAIHQQRLEMR